MKRALTVLLSAASLVVSAVPASAAPPTPGVCDKPAMNQLLAQGYVWDTPWDRCQFKLFFPNHQNLTWNENEWFRGDDVFSIKATTGTYPGSPFDPLHPSKAVVNFFSHIEEHLYWGKLSTPLWALTEMDLSRGPIRFYKGPDYGMIFARDTYYEFAPKTTGIYKWRYTYVEHNCVDQPCSGDVVGHITIEPARWLEGDKRGQAQVQPF
jgi:hypothetical protein